MENSLTLVAAQETTNALEIFTNGNVDNLIAGLEAEVRSVVLDVTTPKGRKEIASLAHKVSRSKTALDSLGKGLVGEWKAKSKAVDSERKQILDRLDALRDEVRAPLTEFEDAEKARAAKAKLDAEKEDAHDQAIHENDLFDRNIEIERKEEAMRLAEADRIEKQKTEDEEKARIAREEQIKRDAAENAKREAEEAAEKEKKASEQKIIDARLAEEQAKRELKEAEEKRVADLKAQEEKLIAEQTERDAEKLRQEAAGKAEADKKAANKSHRKAVNNEILKAICDIGISEISAKELIGMAARGEIPNVKITY